MQRKNVSSGAKWEDIVGYSRAVRMGNIVAVAGTTATDENGNVVGAGDAYQQAVYIFEKIEHALQEVGASMSDVIRTRMYVVNAEDWQAVGKAHSQFFDSVRPVSTLVEVSALIGTDYLVEIEVDAILSDES